MAVNALCRVVDVICLASYVSPITAVFIRVCQICRAKMAGTVRRRFHPSSTCNPAQGVDMALARCRSHGGELHLIVIGPVNERTFFGNRNDQ